MRHLNPPDWPRPKGYSNGIEADGRLVFVAGMIGWDVHGHFPDGIVAQFEQTLDNTVAVLAEAGADASHIVRMTWFVRDLDAYRDNIADIGGVWRKVIGRHFPTMVVVGVGDLVEPEALLEIETTAVVPRDE